MIMVAAGDCSPARHCPKGSSRDPRSSWRCGEQQQAALPSLVEARRPTMPSVLLREPRSEEHTSELQSLMRISYAVFCLKKKNHKQKKTDTRYAANAYRQQYHIIN